MARKTRNTTPTTDPNKLDEIPLDEKPTLALTAAQANLTAAQTMVQLRQNEMQGVLQQIALLYSENGKYIVKGIDLQKMVVTRTEVTEKKEALPPPPMNPH